ncbi:MAG: dihydroorotate dehydrogenase electron transfer subunit [Slackia sp.]|nr:dihydroorotate dehydrogenase electron transfer subunit [Slackia sp.]
MCDCSASKHFDERARVLANEQIGPRLYKITLAAPKMACAIEPGQFVHMQLSGMEAHILRRPFSVYRTDKEAGSIEIIYQVVGEGTAFMTEYAPGVECMLIGAMGHGWQVREGESLIVGGGVGAAPLFLFAEKLADEGRPFEVVLGAQTESMLVTRADYAQLLGRDPILATDDGSVGFAGFCTEPVREALASGAYATVYCCGPEPLMRAVAGIADEAGVPCFVSMEKRMACGVGACLSCVVETVSGKKRSCVDGPVFDAKDVVW